MASLVRSAKRNLKPLTGALPAAGGAVGGLVGTSYVTGLVQSFVPMMEPGSMLGDTVAPIVSGVLTGMAGNAVLKKASAQAAKGVWIGAALGVASRLLAKLFGVTLPGVGLIIAEEGTGAIVADRYGMEGAAGDNGVYVNSGGFGSAVTVNSGGFGAFPNPFAQKSSTF